MASIEYCIEGVLGIHARVAVRIAAFARGNRERARVWIELPDGKRVDMTDVVSLMSLSLRAGDVISIRLDGPEEAQVRDELCELLYEERI